MHGDRVGVRITSHGRSGKAEGRIVVTLERAFTRIVGIFQKTRNFGYVLPDEQRITRDLYIPPGALGAAENGQVVVAEIIIYPTASRSAEGRIVEILAGRTIPESKQISSSGNTTSPRRFPKRSPQRLMLYRKSLPAKRLLKESTCGIT